VQRMAVLRKLRSVSTAMGGGGDYGVFADGRYHLMKTVREMEDWLELRKGRKK